MDINNCGMDAAGLNDRTRSGNSLQEKNLRIQNLLPDAYFKLSDSSIFFDINMFITTPDHRRCQYLILVYIIYTCKERQNLHVRCENSE